MKDQTFKTFGDTLAGLFDSMFTPLIAIAVSLCAIWGIYLGFKFWKSGGDENKRKEAKTQYGLSLSALLSFSLLPLPLRF